MPGGQSESGSQCIHSWSQRTQNIPGWQWHWVFCLLVQGAVSWKPRTCGETRQLGGRAALQGIPALPRHTSLTLVTGAAQLADGQMVPVLIVGVFRARGTNCVPITATFSGDVSAWNGAIRVSGDQGSALTSAACCVTLALSLSVPEYEGWPVSPPVSANWFSWEMVSPCFPRR